MSEAETGLEMSSYNLFSRCSSFFLRRFADVGVDKLSLFSSLSLSLSLSLSFSPLFISLSLSLSLSLFHSLSFSLFLYMDQLDAFLFELCPPQLNLDSLSKLCPFECGGGALLFLFYQHVISGNRAVGPIFPLHFMSMMSN
jgi:hypothetical protein